MKKHTRGKWRGILAGCILIGVLVAWYMFQKAPASVLDGKADYSLTSAQLAEAFYADETAASTKYSGKVIELCGRVAAMSRDAVQSPVISFQQARSELPLITCVMEKTGIPDATIIQQQDSICIRVVCTGKLMDVECNRGVFIKKM
ncbi:MAG TPA: hypothetical protein VLC98_10935 [Phnomibacter sp.]|nr:hypothetical protein [Phnomibacter sp.]